MQCMLGLLLLLVPCYVFYVFNIPLLTKTLRSFLKMVGSLLVLGVLLYEVVALDKPFFTLLFALIIIVWGATLTIVRAKLPLRQLFLPVLAGTFAGVLVVGLYVLLLVMGGANVLEPRYMHQSLRCSPAISSTQTAKPCTFTIWDCATMGSFTTICWPMAPPTAMRSATCCGVQYSSRRCPVCQAWGGLSWACRRW